MRWKNAYGLSSLTGHRMSVYISCLCILLKWNHVFRQSKTITGLTMSHTHGEHIYSGSMLNRRWLNDIKTPSTPKNSSIWNHSHEPTHAHTHTHHKLTNWLNISTCFKHFGHLSSIVRKRFFCETTANVRLIA